MEAAGAGITGQRAPGAKHFRRTEQVAQQCELAYRNLGYYAQGSREYVAARDSYERDKGALARRVLVRILESISEVGRADKEIASMLLATASETGKYHYVRADNLLQSAKLKVESVRATEKGPMTKDVVLPVLLAVEKKSQAVTFIVAREVGAAVAADTFANEQLALGLDKVLIYTKVNAYIFTAEEVAKIAAARDAWRVSATSEPEEAVRPERARLKEVSL